MFIVVPDQPDRSQVDNTPEWRT